MKFTSAAFLAVLCAVAAAMPLEDSPFVEKRCIASGGKNRALQLKPVLKTDLANVVTLDSCDSDVNGCCSGVCAENHGCGCLTCL